MRFRVFSAVLISALFVTLGVSVHAAGAPEFVGDPLPDAPALAPRGQYHVGVRTVQLVDPGRIDILHAVNGKAPLYDRPLTVEVWYPAMILGGKAEITTYHDVLGMANNPQRPLVPFTFVGRALRQAEPNPSGGPYPLVILSHGYPGSRVLYSYLAENLASKGYVVVSIGHTDSTFEDAGPFSSTLLNRSLDDLFVLNKMAELGAPAGTTFLAGLVDANKTAVIGHSMGAYGAINAAGAGYSEKGVKWFAQMTGGSNALEIRSSGNPQFEASRDSRIKAVVAFAPWGMSVGMWDAKGMTGLKAPTLFVDGSQDDVAIYESVRTVFEDAVNCDCYLLTYENARHNVAPNAAPPEALQSFREFYRYAEPAWDQRRINNINEHFVTAFLGIYLKGNQGYRKYLDLIKNSNDGVYDVAADGTPKADNTYWAGFLPRTAVGMQMEHYAPTR